MECYGTIKITFLLNISSKQYLQLKSVDSSRKKLLKKTCGLGVPMQADNVLVKILDKERKLECTKCLLQAEKAGCII